MTRSVSVVSLSPLEQLETQFVSDALQGQQGEF